MQPTQGFSTAYSSSNETTVTYGQKSYGNVILQSLEHSGSLNLIKTTVLGKTLVNGSLHMSYGTLTDLKVNGSCEIISGQVSGSTKINGMLKASQTAFNDIVVSSDCVELESCQVENLKLEDCPGSNQPERIISLKDTTINGNVIVEGKSAIIQMNKASQIKGTLHNAISTIL